MKKLVFDAFQGTSLMIGKITAKDFEQLVYRIINTLESEGVSIVWNASIPDPDSPSNSRQIDILIEKDGKKTHVECRYRKSPQSSNWIEELYGRKISLKVDSIIGVSVSGFYKPAIVKARSLGVIVRDFSQLTENEIRTWGEYASIKGHYLQLINPRLDVFLPKESKAIADTEKNCCTYTQSLEDQNILSTIFSSFSHKAFVRARKHNLGKGVVSPKLSSHLYFPEKMDIYDRDLDLIAFSSKFIISEYELEIAFASLFGEPKSVSSAKEAMVQAFPLKGWELIKTMDEVQLSLDVSSFRHPDNCILERLELVNFKDSKRHKYRLAVTGFDTYKPLTNCHLDFEFHYENITTPEDIDPCIRRFPQIDLGDSVN